MSRKLIAVSIVLIAVGLALLLLSNPFLRFVSRAATPGTTSGGGGFAGTFQGGAPSGFASGQASTFSRGGAATTIIESVIGLGLVAAGLLLEVFSLFLLPKTVRAEAR